MILPTQILGTVVAAWLAWPCTPLEGHRERTQPEPLTIEAASPVLGPVLGAVTDQSVRILIRGPGPGLWRASVWASSQDAGSAVRVMETAEEKNDFVTEFFVGGLAAGTQYEYRVSSATMEIDVREPGPAGTEQALSIGGRFRTLASAREGARLTLAVGSCANDRVFKEQPIWDRLIDASPDGLLLLGDTPYIDSSSLEKQRERRRDFMQVRGLDELRRDTPSWTTWDDHDFGKPDGDGQMEGKDRTRRAFIEYTANDTNGEDGHGVYTTFRFGAAQVFLLDTRYFSRSEPSFADREKLTLLGADQWEWLKRELKASEAPFKILASGMIWNEAVRPNKDDYWMAYPHERGAVFEFVAMEGITGVVLLGGDIHRNRALKHPSEETGVPYPLYEIIASPLANTVIAAANQPHPALIFDAGVQHSAVLLTVDSTGDVARLKARWIDETSKELFAFEVSADELCPPR